MSIYNLGFDEDLTKIIFHLSSVINKYTPNLDAKSVTSFVDYWYIIVQAKYAPPPLVINSII